MNRFVLLAILQASGFSQAVLAATRASEGQGIGTFFGTWLVAFLAWTFAWCPMVLLWDHSKLLQDNRETGTGFHFPLDIPFLIATGAALLLSVGVATAITIF